MKIKIEEKHENILLTRQDITFLVDHSGTATPSRVDVRAKLAAMLNCKEDQLYIIKLTGLYGQSTSQGFAHLYPSKEVAVTHEQAHIIKRHTKEEAAPAPSMEPAETAPEEPKEVLKEEAEKPPKEKVEEKPPKKVEKVQPKKEKAKEEVKKKEEPKAAPKEGKPKKEEKPKKEGKPKKEEKPKKQKAEKTPEKTKGS